MARAAQAAQFVIYLVELSHDLIQRRQVVVAHAAARSGRLGGQPTTHGAWRRTDHLPVGRSGGRCNKLCKRFLSTVCVRTKRRRWASSARNSAHGQGRHPYQWISPAADKRASFITSWASVLTSSGNHAILRGSATNTLADRLVGRS